MTEHLFQDEPLPKWMKQIDMYVVELLHLDSRTGTDHCDTCGKDDGGSYHCTVCADVHSSCGACMVKGHALLPFHHIQVSDQFVFCIHLGSYHCKGMDGLLLQADNT